MFLSLTVTAKPFTWKILMWNHNICIGLFDTCNHFLLLGICPIIICQQYIISEHTLVCLGDGYTLHHYIYCVNNLVYFRNVVNISELNRHLKLFWAGGIPVCQQYKHYCFSFYSSKPITLTSTLEMLRWISLQHL